MKMNIMDKIVNPRVQYLVMDLTCCVNVMLHTVIISMAVNNLQGLMILIYHTQEVFRWHNLYARRFGKREKESKASLTENHVKQYRKYLQLSVKHIVGYPRSILTHHMNTDRVSAK